MLFSDHIVLVVVINLSVILANHIARNMKMSQCLQQFPESYCFDMAVDNNRNRHCMLYLKRRIIFIVVKLRMYDHCPKLHFIRGIGEVSDVWEMFMNHP